MFRRYARAVPTRHRRVDRPATALPVAFAPLLTSKFVLPPVPAAIVPRAGLVERLVAAGSPAVVSIVAPAGYGKTTLLRQWAERTPSFAYLALDHRDNDPLVLLSGIGAALDRVEPLDPAVLRLFASPGHSLESTLLPGLHEAMWGMRTPTLLMLDDVHALDDRASLDSVSFLMLRLPPGIRIALSSRRRLRLPFARLRVAGHLLELGARELAFGADDAQAMAAAIGVSVAPARMKALLARTEGWPAAIYLGLHALGAGAGPDRTEVGLRGTLASVADYLRTELLDPLDADAQAWLLRSSVLGTMTGPICDAALDTTGSLARLRTLEQNNLFVVPVDDHRAAYRYHHLFRDLLRDELDVREPAAAAEVRRRAAIWCAANGEPERAVDYAHASKDLDLVARLVPQHGLTMYWGGRAATLGRWFAWFDRDGLRERYPAIAILASLFSAAEGETDEAERWLGIAEQSTHQGPMPDGSLDRRPWVALLRCYLAPAGMAALQADVRTMLAGIPEHSPFRTASLILGVVSLVLAGSVDEADAMAIQAAELCATRGAYPGLTAVLGQRAVIALARRDPTLAGELVAQGLEVVEAAGLQEYQPTGLLHAVGARVALAAGSIDDARRHLVHVQRLRPRMTAAFPAFAVQARLEAIRACVALREASGARTLLLGIDDVLRVRPDLGVLVSEVDAARLAVAAMRESAPGPWALTSAELRLLAYLPTHLAFREIAERLFVSRHTVKTQAMSIYSKLGATSRGEAVEQAVEVGLLDPSVNRMPAHPGAMTAAIARRG